MPPKRRGPAKEKKSSWEIKILQELQKRRLREEDFKRELAATEKNFKVVENTWRKILRKIQIPLIKEDAEAVWRRFEHTVDIKDQMITLLNEALDEEEEQTVQSEICHSENMQQLLDVFVNRLTDLRRRNNVLVKNLCTTGRTAILEEMRRNVEEVEHQHVIAYIAEMTQIENELQREAAVHARLDDDNNRLAAQVQQVRALLEKKLQRIWNQIINVVAEYQKKTADIRKAYLTLKERDEKIAAEILGLSERIKSLQLQIKNMQDIERKNKEKLASLDGLKEERKDFIHVYTRLRDFLRQDRDGDTERLTELVRQSNESLKWLSKIEKKGERILSLTKLCQHMQTEFETVIANGQLNFTEEMGDNFSESGQEIDLTYDQSTVKETVEIYNKLAIFWRRVGRAQITRNVLAEECESLQTENQKLRMKLSNYLTKVHAYGISEEDSNQHIAKKGFAIIEASHIYKHLIR